MGGSVWLRFGAIAQLVERVLCKQGVTGSIPVGSTRAAGIKRGLDRSRPVCPRDRQELGEIARARTSVLCPATSAFWIFDIVDRNATGRWQGIAWLGRELERQGSYASARRVK